MPAPSQDDSRIPVLVGAGQITQREPDPAKALSPLYLTAEACRNAANDAGPGQKLLESLDTMALLRSFSDTSWRFVSPFGGSKHPPKSLAARLGADQIARKYYTHAGGNMPQYLINRFSEAITRGEMQAAIVTGGEALGTQKAAQRAGLQLDWNEDPGGEPETLGVSTRGWNDAEDRHRMAGAIFAYPMIENAIRGAKGRTIPEHMMAMGRLFEGFAKVAQDNPLADRRDGFTAKQLATITDSNPFIGFPYPKLMNSNAFIDQASAVIVTSVAKAKEMGIPREKWVYLHGCADTYDHWFLADRINFHSSPAMRIAAREAFEMAECGVDDMDFFDLYSCFPSAVQIACAEMGIEEDDPRGLTVTGGLPYFGGPGNNYVTHSIAEMMQRVRAKPGSKGMVTANGNYVTKQAVGIYSTDPSPKPFAPQDPKVYQAEIDRDKGPTFTDHADGAATIETYTVIHDRKGPSYGILYGRLDDGTRFVANPPEDPALLAEMENKDFLGAKGAVTNTDGLNLFVPV
ncbi:MAG: acetyl-CoA acetyltransferase [Alphaproteobacteria bacterium]|jgi:acetyl-CoA C-acetyltransferase